MNEIRKYFIIDLPYAIIAYALSLDMNAKDIHKYRLDETKIVIKTTQLLIDKKINEGVPYDIIFPPSQTNEYTYNATNLIMQTEAWYEQFNL